MNLKQAMVMMSLGLKVTNSSWISHEYVYLKNGEVWDKDNDGAIWGSLTEFETDMQLDYENGWEIYEDPE